MSGAWNSGIKYQRCFSSGPQIIVSKHTTVAAFILASFVVSRATLAKQIFRAHTVTFTNEAQSSRFRIRFRYSLVLPLWSARLAVRHDPAAVVHNNDIQADKQVVATPTLAPVAWLEDRKFFR